jgi:xylulokinase
MKKADLVGHLQTYLHRQLNNARVIDPSQASFTGLFQTLTQGGWDGELCDAMGIEEHQLPQLVESEGVAGLVTRTAGEKFGLTHGTPMLMGCMDTSAAMLLAGAKCGQLLNVVGSTDVLALCTEKPRPHEKLLTRAFGIGKKWVAVSTLAASGSALSWAKDQLYSEISTEKFFDLVDEIGRDKDATDGVSFDPYLAGDRAAIEQTRGAFTGLTLSTTRRQMLAAIIHALADASAKRLALFSEMYPKPSRTVIVSGGVANAVDDLMHRDWPGKWRFHREDEATLRGLAVLAEG